MINNLVVSSITIVLLLTSTCGQKKKEEASSVAIADPVKQDTTKNAPPETTVVPAKQSARPEKTSGLVSHKFMNKGCPTVILVAEPAGDTLVLIPRDALMQDYDVDGLQILFNYRLLKMRSRPGCDKGIPAEITSISKK
jgi:hypothetical protein